MVELRKISVGGKDMLVMPEQIEAYRVAGHEVKVPTKRKITPAMAETLKKEAEAREKEKKVEPVAEEKASDEAVESVMKKVKKGIEKK